MSDMTKLLTALEGISNAISVNNTNPRQHHRAMVKLRHDWPVLWREIHRAMDIYEEVKNDKR